MPVAILVCESYHYMATENKFWHKNYVTICDQQNYMVLCQHTEHTFYCVAKHRKVSASWE